jgi:hypothetical protein
LYLNNNGSASTRTVSAQLNCIGLS